MIETPVAIVTGAGSGIGRAAALELAARNWATVLVGRDESKLHVTAEQIGDRAPTLVHPADVSDPQQCADLIAVTSQQFGRIDGLVQAAGIVAVANLRDTTVATWRKLIDTDLSAAFYLTRACWDVLVRSGGGVIVNVSSMAAVDPFEGLGAYAVAKAGLNMLTHVTAKEGEAVNIRAVSVMPGAVDTPMLREAFGESDMPKLTPDGVGKMIAGCITGERAIRSGEGIRVLPGWPATGV